MSFALTVIFGVPLILLTLGFVIIALKAFGGEAGYRERSQTLELARQLERSLSVIENRLTALEDIFLSPDKKKGSFDD